MAESVELRRYVRNLETVEESPGFTITRPDIMKESLLVGGSFMVNNEDRDVVDVTTDPSEHSVLQLTYPRTS